MPNSTLELARHLLGELGYDDASIRSEYPVWLGRVRGTRRADMVAFGHPEPTDMSTATITVTLETPDVGYQLAQALAAPYMLLGGKVGLDLWVAEPDGPHRWQEDINLADAPQVAEWLKPSAALRSKVGLRQLPLFDLPVNLLANARDAGVNQLGPIVNEALRETSAFLGVTAKGRNTGIRQRRHQRAAQLVISSLVSLVLRDRNNWRDESVSSLLQRASGQFPIIYGWLPDSTDREKEILASLIEGLGEGIDYTSFDPVILSQVYGDALVTSDDRLKLGIHYTPPRLAHKIFEHMPVELIEPEGRHVLDPACGSGNLLIAAHDRLRDLQPDDWNLDRQHTDLAVHLHGIDVDPFAVEIAENALFLHANPAGNGWQIQREDTLTIDPREVDASIIATNPPWRYTSSGGIRRQAASEFLQWSITALNPGGLLAIVLPNSWMTSDYSAKLRGEIQTTLDTFEIWRLPVDLFESSHQASCVLIGRKRDGLGGKGSRIVREVHSQDLETFLRTDVPKAVHVIKDTSEDLWKGIDFPAPKFEMQRLDSLAVIRSGPQPKSSVSSRTSGVLFLNHFADVKPYAAVSEDVLWRLSFPEDFQGKRGEVLIDKKKVLVTAAGTGADPWPLRVSVDNIGVAFRNSMRWVDTYDQTDERLLYALCIIIGSGLTATFAASYGFDRNVPAAVLNDLPIPVSRQWINLLSEFGRAAVRTATSGNVSELQDVLVEAEPAVWAAYGYTENDRAVLTQRLSGEPSPEGKPRYPVRPSVPYRSDFGFRRYGCVLDADGYSVKVWVNGITPPDGTLVKLPDHMLGWLVRPGATFDVFGAESEEDLSTATYRLQPEAWADIDLDSDTPSEIFDEELLRKFTP